MAKKRNSAAAHYQKWTGADHAIRQQKKDQKRQKTEEKASKAAARVERRENMTHESKVRRDALKVQLNITKVKRDVDQLRKRLASWDSQEEEKKRLEAEAEAKKLAEAEGEEQKKRRGRLGPETWQLKGPARPAHLVYDFDVRYVCPHIEAHKVASEKAQRSENMLSTRKGQFGALCMQELSTEPALSSAARNFLGLLMQLGHLYHEANQHKLAREMFLECIELEGDSDIVTTARENLMKMYLELERYESAYNLGKRLLHVLPHDVRREGSEIEEEAAAVASSSVWINYSFALVSLCLKKNDAEKYVRRAIQANPFCAYYLSFYDVFSSVMEYTQELEEAEDVPETSLEEAIEYCCCSSQQQKIWASIPGSLESLRGTLLRALRGEYHTLKAENVECEKRLTQIENDFKLREEAKCKNDQSKGEGPDILMYAGMFRTALEMLRDSGRI